LTGARALGDVDAVNVAQIILSGSGRTASSADFVPAFCAAYSDLEVAALASYVVARFGGHAASISSEEVAALRKLSSCP
jgi:mono/diheme cytochrome c family protein